MYFKMTKVKPIVLVSVRIKTSSLRIYFSSTNFLHGFWSRFVVQLLSCIRLFVTTWTAARQASLSFIIFQSLLKLMFIKSVMPSNHLILCPLLLLPSILPRVRLSGSFVIESALCIRWPKYWSFSFNWSRSKLTEYKMMLINNTLCSDTRICVLYFHSSIHGHT